MKILVVNCGSSSLKYQLIDMDGEKMLAKGLCERIGVDGHFEGKTPDGRKTENNNILNNHTEAFMEVKKALTEGETKVIDSLDEIDAIGHRIVQGGALFNDSVLVTEEVKKGIESLIDLAPLHNAAHLQGINACQEVFGMDKPEVVVFDNAFHSTMPPKAFIFPVPYEYYEKYKVRRYGFHGTSHRYVSKRLSEIWGTSLEGKKVIVAHIGNGSSLSAIKDGKVIDTTMGITPLDGFIMGSRCGGVDPSAITYIQAKEGLTPAETDQMMNKKSGLLGISGVSSDMRDVEKAAADGNERAQLALDILEYQVTKYMGAFVAALGGVDAICFTAGVGENSPSLRQAVCENLSFLGIEIDADRNRIRGEELKISTENSKVEVYVIPTNEELMIARDTREIVEKL
ncbi:MAG: acetate kinase [Clostridia bacterium]|nr:acetate kinase [Clostridia bacterium]